MGRVYLSGMCRRFTQLRSWADLVRLYRITDSSPAANWPPRYNIAPTQDIAVAYLGGDGGRRLVPMRWGLVPRWANDRAIGARMINARAETLAQNSAFRWALQHRRCIVPADGFYEWRKLPDGRRQPYRLSWDDHQPLAFAGLWDRWNKTADGRPLLSCAIITTAPNELVRPLHDRMPAILDAAGQAAWLGHQADDEAAVRALLRPFPAAQMIAHPVDAYVNAADNEGPRCIQPPAATLLDFGL
jgi:putative SOS response-associated peptidase YedK